RILEVHLDVDGHDLVVVAAHWTSRLKGGEASRANYGDVIYGRYQAMWKANRQVAFLVCGDFNDNPTDPSVVEHLRAVADREQVLAGGAPLLYNLFARHYDEGRATHVYAGRNYVFDQIAVSPALLTGPGLRIDPASARVVPEKAFKGRPDRF